MKRMQRIAKDQKLSVRETKMLRKMLKKHTKGTRVDIQEYAFHFPGRKLDVIEKVIRKILRIKPGTNVSNIMAPCVESL